ncbi:hypothetical protein IWX91DRAFT_171809 [Phyllosticta citricarpa]
MAAILDLPVSLNSLPLQAADECVFRQVGITVQSGILCSNCVLDHRLGKNYSTEPVPSSFNCPTSIKIPLSAATSSPLSSRISPVRLSPLTRHRPLSRKRPPPQNLLPHDHPPSRRRLSSTAPTALTLLLLSSRNLSFRRLCLHRRRTHRRNSGCLLFGGVFFLATPRSKYRIATPLFPSPPLIASISPIPWFPSSAGLVLHVYRLRHCLPVPSEPSH